MRARARCGRETPLMYRPVGGMSARSAAPAAATGLVMTRDEYPRTRVMELVVHADDLAAYVGVKLAPPQPGTCQIAMDALVDVA